jgi:hypothetical protein
MLSITCTYHTLSVVLLNVILLSVVAPKMKCCKYGFSVKSVDSWLYILLLNVLIEDLVYKSAANTKTPILTKNVVFKLKYTTQALCRLSTWCVSLKVNLSVFAETYILCCIIKTSHNFSNYIMYIILLSGDTNRCQCYKTLSLCHSENSARIVISRFFQPIFTSKAEIICLLWSIDLTCKY